MRIAKSWANVETEGSLSNPGVTSLTLMPRYRPTLNEELWNSCNL